MTSLLVGDATATYTEDNSDGHHYQQAWRYRATASGVLTELRFRTSSTANTSSTGIELGIYDDASGVPDALLDSGLYSGEPPTDTWVSVTGLSVRIIAGRYYWLAILPEGFRVHYNSAVASGGTPDLGFANLTGSLITPWDTGATDPDYEDGPVGFQGLGTASFVGATQVDVGLTTLHRPEKTTSPTADEEHARVLAWAFDYSDLLVSIPRNDARTGQVSFSFDDPIVAHLYRDAHENVTDHEVQITTAFEVMLFVRYRGTPILWAPVVSMDFQMADRKVTINAVDAQMLMDHQIHTGDDALPDATADRWVPATSDGIRTLMAAATPSTEQTDDGTPSHGINMPAAGIGTTAGETMQIATARDDPVFEKVVELAGYEDSVDFSIVPRDVEDPSAFPYYADMVCYEEQGSDLSDSVIFHAGFGRDNAETLDWAPGGPYMTHAVIRDADNKFRVPRANVDARRRTGIYSHSENLPSASPAGTMTARAQALLKQYSFPVDAHTVVLRDDPSELEQLAAIAYVTFHYPDDFDLGDKITSEAQDGYYEKRVQGQINEFRLRQADGAIFKQEIDLVPELVDVTEIGDEDP